MVHASRLLGTNFRVLAAMAVVLAALGWGTGRALAETKTGSFGGGSTWSTTNSMTNTSQGTGGDGSSQSVVSMDSIEAHIKGFNNDGGWHMLEYSNGYATGTWAYSGFAYAGGRDSGSGAYLCGSASCYTNTQSYYQLGGSSLFEYTSDNGSHSSESCWVTPGC